MVDDYLFEEIIERIKAGTGIKTQTELAKILNIPHQSISTAKKKGRIPDKWVIYLCLQYKLSPIWLLTGEGPQYIEDKGQYKVAGNGSEHTISFQDAIVAEHASLVRQFNDSESGKAINEDLIYIEKADKQSFYEVKGYVKGIANGLRTIERTSKQQGRVVGQSKEKKKHA